MLDLSPYATREDVLQALSMASELERRRCEVDFGFFARRFWHTIEPATRYVHGPHIEAIVDHLDACLPRVTEKVDVLSDGTRLKVRKVEPGQIRKLLINMPPRHMKLLDDETPVPTPIGIRRHGDLRVGDEVFGVDGLPAKIIAISPDAPSDFEVEFSTGEVIRCNGDHLWRVLDRHGRVWRTLDTATLLELHASDVGRSRFFIPDAPCLSFPASDLPLDPYFFGCWLGDGSSTKPCITHAADDRAHIDAIVSRGLRISTECSGGTVTYFSGQGVLEALRALGVRGRKSIPEIYQRASESQRLDLLAGLIDTDGSVEPVTSRVRYSTCDERIRDDVFRLVVGLGFHPYITTVPAPGYGEYSSDKTCYQVCFQPTRSIPTQLARKRIVRTYPSHRLRAIRLVRRSASPGVGHCITVDREDGLYVAGSTHVVTHNSTLVSVLWPAYVWTRRPEFRWLFTSYSKALAIRDTMRMRAVLMSPHYQYLWASRFRLLPDQNEKSKFFNTSMGYRVSGSVESGVTGEGGDGVIVDDPHNVHDADSERVRETTENWWFESMSTRLNDPDTGFHVAVFQRVHEKDIAAKCIERGYVHLNLPARYDPKRSCVTVLGWKDWRTEEGQLLWPDRFSEPTMAALETDLGAYGTASQLQQDPKPRGGAFIKREWFKRVDAKNLEKIVGGIFWGRGWDLALNKEGDLVAGVEGGFDGDGNFYLRRGVFWHEDSPISEERIELIGEHERNRVVVEAIGTTRSMGLSVAARLSGKCLVEVIDSKENKVSMAIPWISLAQAGKVFLVEEADASGELDPSLRGSWPFYSYNKVAWIDRFLDVATSWKPDPTLSQVDDPIDAVSLIYHGMSKFVDLKRTLVPGVLPGSITDGHVESVDPEDDDFDEYDNRFS